MEGQQPNTARTGLGVSLVASTGRTRFGTFGCPGWDGERRRSRPTRRKPRDRECLRSHIAFELSQGSVDSGSDWCRIGSAYDARGKAKSTGRAWLGYAPAQGVLSSSAKDLLYHPYLALSARAAQSAYSGCSLCMGCRAFVWYFCPPAGSIPLLCRGSPEEDRLRFRAARICERKAREPWCCS